MSIYQELGIKTLINAWGTVTKISGSTMAPEVLDAMAEAGETLCGAQHVSRGRRRAYCKADRRRSLLHHLWRGGGTGNCSVRLHCAHGSRSAPATAGYHGVEG